jgi:hypothetical protein
MISRKKRLFSILSGVILLLLIPFSAMRFTDEVNWTVSDFFAAGILLTTTGLICEFVIRTVKKTKVQIAIYLVIFAILLTIWVELSVGIFGTSFAGN